MVVITDATSLWKISMASSGKFDLKFNGKEVLHEACPSFRPTNDSKGAVSFCAGSLFHKRLYDATLNDATHGIDPRFGKFTLESITYTPRSSSAPSSKAALNIKIFDSPSRVVHLQLQFSDPLTTNWVSPLASAKWHLGGGIFEEEPRVMNVPMDNDVQSMYASLPVVHGTSMFVTAVYEEKKKTGLVLGFLDHDLFKTGIEYGVTEVNTA